jgi:hypothetical protein
MRITREFHLALVSLRTRNLVSVNSSYSLVVNLVSDDLVHVSLEEMQDEINVVVLLIVRGDVCLGAESQLDDLGLFI